MAGNIGPMPTAPPLPYAQPIPADRPAVPRWSPWPLSLALAGLVGVLCATLAAAVVYAEPTFDRWSTEWKFPLPTSTAAALAAGHVALHWWASAPAVVAAFAVPFVIVRRMAAPPAAVGRRRVVRLVRLAVSLVVMGTCFWLVAAACQPYVAVLGSASDPKR